MQGTRKVPKATRSCLYNSCNCDYPVQEGLTGSAELEAAAQIITEREKELQSL